MKRILIILLLLTGCSRLPALTAPILTEAEQKWKAQRPDYYRLVIDMSGDRVETGTFEVAVRGGQVVSFRRNGMIISPDRGQDYSMDGLFHMLRQEVGLAAKPSMLGTPAGYSVYIMARFDETDGRLMQYRRTVGGASNTIEIDVREFDTMQVFGYRDGGHARSVRHPNAPLFRCSQIDVVGTCSPNGYQLQLRALTQDFSTETGTCADVDDNFRSRDAVQQVFRRRRTGRIRSYICAARRARKKRSGLMLKRVSRQDTKKCGPVLRRRTWAGF